MNRKWIASTFAVLLLGVVLGESAGLFSQPAAPKQAVAPKSTPQPSWIWLGTPKDNDIIYFVKTFQANGVTKAQLQITADNAVKAYLDGTEVASGDDWSSLVTKDVTAVFQKSPGATHVLAVEARNEGGAAAMIAKLTLQMGTNTTAIVSDASWVASRESANGWNKPGFDATSWAKTSIVGKLGAGPWTSINARAFNRPGSTSTAMNAVDPKKLKVAKDFQVELLYSVPKDVEGSWVSMCTDPKGRLIVCDQYGGLFRVTVPAIGGNASETKVEKIPVNLGEAQGLLWAFDRLYVVVNGAGKFQSGLYQVTDTNNDDVLDDVKMLRKLIGGGEHGPHAVMLTPDGKNLVVVCGNATKMTEIVDSRVPLIWGEDHLLPRMPDGRGFMVGVPPPGGCIYQLDRDGKEWTLLSMGYRNQYDAAFNKYGDLFTYDADMEWDMNTPWYRPTRVCMSASGAEFGWRNGAGKWPAHYPDSLPAIVNIGPGSPTGVTFGYGAKFPAKYQDAFFICDWSYGKLYAVHMSPDGSAYSGALEEFVTGTPLPLTDLVVNPKDGALYFAVGGRRTSSALYRVTYVGNESTEPVKVDEAGAEQRAIRRSLEANHKKLADPKAAIDQAWKYLGSSDRYLRWAARVVLEHQDVAAWQDRALSETDPIAATTALLALCRKGTPDLQAKTLAALDAISWSKLDESQQTDLARVYQIALIRLGKLDDSARTKLIAKLDGIYPTKKRLVDVELANLMVFLQAPTAAAKTVALLNDAPTQEEQIDLARALRVLKAGWTPALRTQYFSWFLKASTFKGGNSFGGFMANIKRDAIETLSAEEKVALKPLIDAQVGGVATITKVPPRAKVKEWTMNDLADKVAGGLKGRDFDKGRKLFGEANCFACHRYSDEGGAQGPDLTGVAGRFGPKDLLESILDPNKEISDQYAAVEITTDDDRLIIGRIINLSGDGIILNTNMLDPNSQTTVDRKRVESMALSKVSMMPKGLLDTLNEDEIMDLLAYLLSRGDRKSPMFQK
ncbi:c-type cytochrome [Tuwongella immobilis]|uniref:Cytochrome c domain-containing protein n=1 Tax=Tuwongella immobilis TaxID=692036 RepID=A0A6C2YMV2_9BACT|nr:c-type cytochrome [Tuwongella immobilis]VIP02539.1 heme-binding protein : Putative heme-binding domain-containing protein OS=Singulisphaera acidiphila (strain ATCC BAA-1392 / DSM 18658 / VKM B-2454 / MOB10) GN=Sinac_4636 PE=4 SV=1: Cytochrom_C [Tuwongella immobilis]VTS01706.1 heme-binding protein : Putative heme-binding domain-containing protein OS=Singulisphaera acidiphila (strain ATCC BAA-1392 / DSM 18658 / VKM B-2454 / MOB10) GN=Sinac_4636 PE=4 SV=1: Cytochrom_C [Tuwongella immobilis]